MSAEELTNAEEYPEERGMGASDRGIPSTFEVYINETRATSIWIRTTLCQFGCTMSVWLRWALES